MTAGELPGLGDLWRAEMAANRRRGHADRPMPFLPQHPPTPDELEARRRLRSMPYDQYLRTRHWRVRRDRALWLAGDRCEHCGTRHHLQVHHLTYDRRGCELDEDLVALCDRCHENTHAAAQALAVGGEDHNAGHAEIRHALTGITGDLARLYRRHDDDGWRHFIDEEEQ